MKRVRILPFKERPVIRLLASLSGTLMCKLPTKFIPQKGDIVVNFGSSELPEAWKACIYKIINSPSAVSNSIDKLKALSILKEHDVSVPKFTSSQAQVVKWLEQGHQVMARKLTKASCGKGAVMITPEQPVCPNAPLYTLYVPKKAEYRVHVWGGEVIDMQQKKRRKDFDKTKVDTKIRTWDTGWVYCRGGINVPDVVVEQAKKAVAALGLDFGAVDIGYTESNGKATVYEVNTAPGLEGTTLKKYASKIKELTL